MGDYKNIEKELLSIDQSKMQDIVFQILSKRYTPTNIVNLGSASGVQTTRRGTPDMFLQLRNGNYIFAETTIQKKQLLDKIKSDISKCNDYAKKLLDKKAIVEKVIFVCVGKLNTNELQECQNLCKEFCGNKDCPFEFWGLDKLCTLLLHTYQSIAASELNIQFSYGFVETLDDHLQNNEYDVSQQHEFLFREEELLEIESKLFDKNIVLLHGVAGCGKTRLCIHLAQKLKANNQIKEIYYVQNAYNKGFDSLCTVLDQDKIAIILDDINRIPFIKEFIFYAQKHKNIYVLATVRDYAIDTIVRDLKNNNLDNYLYFINIIPLSKEQQEKILKKIIPNISYDALFSIQSVAHGNLRFAIMMAEVLKKDGYLPNKMKDLMERHFVRINSDLENSVITRSNNICLKSLVILSFFHRIVVEEGDTNWIIISGALDKLGISMDAFHDSMAYWDEKEIVNISFEGKVYEIGDQILSSYLFYKMVIDEKQIILDTVFELFFPQYRKCFVDMFNSILPAYGYQDSEIVQQLVNIWKLKYKNKNDETTIQFISAFYGLLPLDTLAYIKKQKIPFNDEVIDILCRYESSDYYAVAIDLLFNHIDNCELQENTIKRITESFSINKNSFSQNLVSQKYLLNKLNERILRNDNCKKMFLDITKKLLGFSFHSSEFHSNSMVYFTITAVPCKCLFEMRAVIWNTLIKLYGESDYKLISDLLKDYKYIPNNTKRFKEILDNDKKTILPFVKNETIKQLMFGQAIALKSFLECCFSDDDIVYQEILKQLETNNTSFQIYSNVFSRKREEQFDWTLKTNKYINVYKKINIPTDFYSYIVALQSVETDINVISFAVNSYFEFVNNNYPSLFETNLKDFILKFQNLDISYNQIAHMLSEKYNINEFISIVKSSSMVHKRNVLLELLQKIKKEDMSLDLYTLCLETIIEEYCLVDVVSSRIIRLSDYIEYEYYKSGFILKIFKAIQNSQNNNWNKYRLLEDFYYGMEFKSWGYKNLSMERIESFFGCEIASVYYEMFFKLIKSNILYTSDEFIYYIASKNVEYLYRYYDLFFIHEREFAFDTYLDINALSKLPNVAQNMLIIYERSKKESLYFYSTFTLEKIMAQNLNDEIFSEFVELFIEKYALEESDLRNMSSCIASLKSSWQIMYTRAIISKNIEIDIFQRIRVFTHPSSWSGSEVNMYEKLIETIDLFLSESLVTTVNISYITIIKELRDKYVKDQMVARLRELSDYNFYA